jgi:F-type H+-transporting ATPase subunit b
VSQRSLVRLARSLAFVAAAGLLGLTPALASADSEQEVADEAGDAADHGEGHHGGAVTLREIVAGHDSLQFWGSVVNFSLLVYLIIRATKRPTREFLEARRNEIEKGIKEAAEAKAKAEAIQREYTERMKTLDQELVKLRSDIAASAAEDRARIVAEAEESAKRVKSETEQLVQRQSEQLEADIRREVVAAAVKAAEDAVRQAATPDDQRRLAETFAQELSRLSVEKRA